MACLSNTTKYLGTTITMYQNLDILNLHRGLLRRKSTDSLLRWIPEITAYFYTLILNTVNCSLQIWIFSVAYVIYTATIKLKSTLKILFLDFNFEFCINSPVKRVFVPVCFCLSGFLSHFFASSENINI